MYFSSDEDKAFKNIPAFSAVPETMLLDTTTPNAAPGMVLSQLAAQTPARRFRLILGA
jgi:hypothetical protein